MSIRDYDGKKDNSFSIRSYNGMKRMQPFYDDLRQLSDVLDFLTSYKMGSVSGMEVTIIDTVYAMNAIEKSKLLSAIGTIKRYKDLMEKDRFYHYSHAGSLEEIFGAADELRNDLACRLKTVVESMLDKKRKKDMKRDGEIIYIHYELLEKHASDLYDKTKYSMDEFKVFARDKSSGETARKIEKDILDDKETKEN